MVSHAFPRAQGHRPVAEGLSCRRCPWPSCHATLKASWPAGSTPHPLTCVSTQPNTHITDTNTRHSPCRRCPWSSYRTVAGSPPMHQTTRVLTQLNTHAHSSPPCRRCPWSSCRTIASSSTSWQPRCVGGPMGMCTGTSPACVSQGAGLLWACSHARS